MALVKQELPRHIREKPGHYLANGQQMTIPSGVNRNKKGAKIKKKMKNIKLITLTLLFCTFLSLLCVAGAIDVEKSMQYYNNKIKNGTAGVDDYYWMGHLYFYQLKDYRKAAEYFLKGSELDKTRADVLVGAGMSYVRLKEFEEALKYLKRAQAIDPKVPQAFHQAGECYYYLGKFELAKGEFEKALVLTPEDAATCGLYGDTLYFLEDYDDAEKYLLKAVEYGYDPGIDFIYGKLSAVYDKKGDIDKEVFYLKKCIKVNPKYWGSYHDLGVAYYKKKQYKEAIRCFNNAIKHSKQSYSFYYLAKVYNDLGEDDEAIKYLDKSEEYLKYDTNLEWQKVTKGQIDELRKEILSNRK